jgi:hypothetical protein
MICQLHYLAAIPGADALLAVGGLWGPAAVLFFLGAPLFWWLRNRKARRFRLGRFREIRTLNDQPTRYEIPPNIQALLSTESLDDVPASIRTSLGPTIDGNYQFGVSALTLQKVGTLSPWTHFAVVYRLCFAPFMEQKEEPLFLRFGLINTGVGPSTGSVRMGDDESGWILVTTFAVKWHLVNDHVPGMPPRSPLDSMLAGAREVFFGPRTSSAESGPQAGPGASVLRGITLQHEDDHHDTWRHVILIGDDPSAVSVLAEIRTRTRGNE